MAKPGSAPTPWATNTNYAGGPASGTPTKASVPSQVQTDGWRPDQKPPAQWENFWHNEIYQWCSWVNDGSYSGAEDAHILETNSTGAVIIARLNVGPISTGYASLDVIGPNPPSTNPGLVVQGYTTSGDGIVVVSNNGASSLCNGIHSTGGSGGGAGVKAIGGGTGPGVNAIGGTGSGGDGIACAAGSGSNGRGVDAQGDGTGAGVRTYGGSQGDGVRAYGNGAADGIFAQALGTGAGATCQGGTGSAGYGVDALAGDADAHGIRSRTDASATPFVAAVYGSGRSEGIGVAGVAEDGYGVLCQSDTSSPTRAALRIIGQDADPTSANGGDVYYNDNDDVLKVRENVTWRAVWATSGGFVRSYGTDRSANNTTSSTMQVVTSASVAVLSTTAKINITVNFEMGSGNTGSTFEYDVYDSTDSTVVIGPETCYVSGALEARHVIDRADYTPGDTLSHNYQLRYRSTDGSTTSFITNASIEVTGAYE